MLIVDDLKMNFCEGNRNVEALKGVGFSVHDSEFVAIMGPSGCGKSTLLHLIAGLAKPEAGSIVLNGINQKDMTNNQRAVFRRDHIGYIFQNLNLLPSLTVEENIILSNLLGGKSQCDLVEILELLNILDLRNERSVNLSGGEKQRVAIARSLFVNPSIVLADEPTGSLDYENGQNFCRVLKESQRKTKSSVLLVTHEPVVAQWADRVLIMKDGLIVSEIEKKDFDSEAELFARYQEALEEKTGAA